MVIADLNTLDWGKNNILAVGLNNSLYLWNASTGNTSLLMELEGREDYISSVSWSSNGKYLAVGDSTACVQLWDAEKQKKIRTMRGHSDRVGVLAWNKHTVARYGSFLDLQSIRASYWGYNIYMVIVVDLKHSMLKSACNTGQINFSSYSLGGGEGFLLCLAIGSH